MDFPDITWIKAPAADTQDTAAVAATVAQILADVHAQGDAAMRDHARRLVGGLLAKRGAIVSREALGQPVWRKVRIAFARTGHVRTKGGIWTTS